MTRRGDWVRLAALALIAVAAAFNYRYMFDFTMVMFASPIEDMSHGWVVPFVSLAVLWRQRGALRAAAGAPSAAGAAWTALFLVIAWFGGRGGQSRLEQVSFIGLVWALPYAFWGHGVERLMRFPAVFLCFTIPVSSFIDFFTIHLRILSTAFATGLLNGVGLAVERSGTALYSRVPGSEFNVDVADPCSGIRSLFAMMALTAAYAYFTQRGTWRKWLLFACSLPIAVIGNMVRIMSICVVAAWFGQQAATGYYHDYSGYVVFLVGVLLMVQAGEWMKGRRKREEVVSNREEVISNREEAVSNREEGGGRRKEGDENAERSTLNAERSNSGMGIVVCVGVAVLAVFAARLTLPPPVFDTSSCVASELPARVGEFMGEVPWFCHNPQCLAMAEEPELTRGPEGFVCPECGGRMAAVSLGEWSDLPKDTVIVKRNYRSADGLVYAVSVVVGGRQRNSIHRAELCLPAQGFAMLDAARVPLALADGRSLQVRRINAQRPGGARMSLVYWFLSHDRVCCSHTERILMDVWDRSIHNRINRWVMIAVNVSSGLDSPEGIERFEAFLSELYPKVVLGRVKDNE
ncbi:MAG: EpsI family protein [Lentisphaerae bacterium]|nr:EpsI family protein [Lentisphaerota bacterium]